VQARAPEVRFEAPRVSVDTNTNAKLNANYQAGFDSNAKLNANYKAGLDVNVKAPEVRV